MSSIHTFLRFQMVFVVLSAILLNLALDPFVASEDKVAIITGRTLTGLVMTTLLHLCYQGAWLRLAGAWVKWPAIFLLNLLFVEVGAWVWGWLISQGVREVSGPSPFVEIKVARAYSLLVWNMGYWGVDFFLRYHALKLEAAEGRLAIRSAELKQLQAQMNPHFLFNSLTLVQSKIPEDSPAQEIVQRLSEYLRFSLETTHSLEPLAREFEMLECYLDLQRARFGGNLECSIEVTPEALQVWVPAMLVQPLLENAFKFGPRSSPLPLRVEVKALVEKGRLLIHVVNTGSWFALPTGATGGTGLNNLRRRMTILLGETAELTIGEDPGSVRVELNIPVLPAKADNSREYV